jgi:hypothetical protein
MPRARKMRSDRRKHGSTSRSGASKKRGTHGGGLGERHGVRRHARSPRHRAEQVLANEETARTRLGDDVLVKMKMDELLEQKFVPMDMSAVVLGIGDRQTTMVITTVRGSAVG